MDKIELLEMLRKYLTVDVRVDNGGDEDRIRVSVKIKFDGIDIAEDKDSETVCVSTRRDV